MLANSVSNAGSVHEGTSKLHEHFKKSGFSYLVEIKFISPQQKNSSDHKQKRLIYDTTDFIYDEDWGPDLVI